MPAWDECSDCSKVLTNEILIIKLKILLYNSNNNKRAINGLLGILVDESRVDVVSAKLLWQLLCGNFLSHL
jgi:hypothetical protein